MRDLFWFHFAAPSLALCIGVYFFSCFRVLFRVLVLVLRERGRNCVDHILSLRGEEGMHVGFRVFLVNR